MTRALGISQQRATACSTRATLDKSEVKIRVMIRVRVRFRVRFGLRGKSQMHLHCSDQRQVVEQRLQANPRAAAAHDVRHRHLQ